MPKEHRPAELGCPAVVATARSRVAALGRHALLPPAHVLALALWHQQQHVRNTLLQAHHQEH